MKIGIQMFSVTESMDKDPIGTMKKVADMGYKYWETCEIFDSDRPNNFGLCLPAKEGKALIDDLGVTIIGCHLSTRVRENEDLLLEFLDYQAEVNCWSPGMAIDLFMDVDDIKRKCESYNHLGELCKERGMVFHYHNHFHEFQIMEGKYVMDHILENTDPDLVKFELDTYWAVRGGVDPVKMIDRYKDRLIMMHQKDMPDFMRGRENLFDGVVNPNAPILWDVFAPESEIYAGQCMFAEVGTGILDIQSYIDAGNAAGVPYISLEQDQSIYGDLQSVQMSMDAFRKFHGVEWA